MPGVRQPVSGPIPTAPNDGLRAARGLGVIENPNDPLDPQRQWVRGYTFDYGPCNTGTTGDPCDVGPKQPVEGRQSTRCVEPFLVIVGRSCSTWGWEAADYQTDAVRLLDAFQYEIIARELWRGDQARASGWDNADCADGAGNPYLAADWNPDFVNLGDINGGAPGDTMTPVEALAALEDFGASCSTGPSLIHATRRMVVAWGAQGLVVREGGRLFTIAGTQLVADQAYDGSAPDSLGNAAASADSEWAYLTGPITLRLETGPPMVTPTRFEEAVDRADNTITYIAERKASASWGCCHAGVAIQPVYPSC